MSSLTEVARYAFEAVEGDTVSTITPSEHDGGYSLNYEARSTAGLLTLTDYWHILYLIVISIVLNMKLALLVTSS